MTPLPETNSVALGTPSLLGSIDVDEGLASSEGLVTVDSDRRRDGREEQPMEDRLSPWLVATVGLMLVGCGTMFQGLTQKVRLTTTPVGATASMGGATTTTPGDVTVRRAEWVVVRAGKQGYGEACRIVPGRHNPLFAFLNSVPAGLGWIVDRPTQANRRFPEEVHLDLPASTVEPLPPDEVILQ